jgi:16S rRNA pseudouridine516 synthase
MPRLDQLLASLGYGSRRGVSEWVREGRVSVLGVPARNPAAHVAADTVRVDGEALDHPGELLLLMNKPAGRVCSHEAAEGASVYELLPARWRRRNPVITSIGRLDKDTTGLLLLTDRSALVHRLTSPRHKVPKVYRATLDRDPPAGTAELFGSGTLVLPDEKDPCAPAALTPVGPRVAELTLTEGRYHQVKRMFAVQGCEVLELERVRFGPLEIGNVARGSWIELPINSLDSL